MNTLYSAENWHRIQKKNIEKVKFNNNLRNYNDTLVRILKDGLLKYLNFVKDQLLRAPENWENWVFFFHQIETIFEVYEVSNEYWDKIILNKLEHFVRNLTNNLGVEKLCDYKSIKDFILAKNSQTPLQHKKKKIEDCQKRHNENYVQWIARAKASLDYHLESREVKNFQDLKDLMLSDKIRDSLRRDT